MNPTDKDEAEVTLPHGWIKGISKSQNRPYYFCKATQHTQWHFPTATEVADPIKAKQRLLDAAASASASSSNATLSTNLDRYHHHHGTEEQSLKRKVISTASFSSSSSVLSSKPQPSLSLGDIPISTVAPAASSSSMSTSSIPKRPKLQSSHSTTVEDFNTNAITTTTTTTTMNIHNKSNPKPTQPIVSSDSTSVAIIVPYRDIHPSQNRSKHLQTFIPHMHSFLSKQVQKGICADYHIYIVEQSDDGRKFNRGKLLNIGFDLARKNKCRSTSTSTSTSSSSHNTVPIPHDVFIFHDVDLLPDPTLERYYTQFPTVPLHIARVWDRYSNNPKYFGGIVSFSASDMKRINGYPNTFWGWGGEDDEMQKRCERLGLKWESPRNGKVIDLEEMTLEDKLQHLREHKEWKCMVKWEALEEHEGTWRTNGLADLSYTVLKKMDLDEGGYAQGSGGSILGDHRSRATKITVDVKLNGTHWTNDKCGADD